MRWSNLGIVTVLAGLAACGGHDMDGRIDSLRAHLTEVEQEHARHAEAIDGATDLGVVEEEERLHATRMLEHMDRMSREMGGMGCEDMHGGSSHSYRMQDGLAEMGDACEDHERSMVEAGSTDAARAEESLHQGDMRVHLGGMRMEADRMMQEDDDGVDCPGTFHP